MPESVKQSSTLGLGDQKFTTSLHFGAKQPWPDMASLGQRLQAMARKGRPWHAMIVHTMAHPGRPWSSYGRARPWPATAGQMAGQIVGQIARVCQSSKDAETLNMATIIEDAIYTAKQVEILIFGNYQRRIEIRLFTDSDAILESIASSKQI